MPTMALDEIADADRPEQIITLLQHYAELYGNLNVYGAWRIPIHPGEYRRGYPLGKAMFIHPQARAHYVIHIQKAREFGPNVLARMAWVARKPFTITECMRETRPRGHERWVFTLLRQYGIRDGLYCPVNGWVVLFWSPAVLHLSLKHRGILYSLAMQASMRLDEIVPGLKEPRAVRLSARELAVLHHLSNGAGDAWIATELGIGVGSIRTYVLRAMKKLGAKTREHAVAEAMRQLLVK